MNLATVVLIRLLKIVGVIAGILVSLVVITVLATIVINWRDAPPSAEYLRLKKLIRDRPVVAAGDNAFIYVLGIHASAGVDPQDLGAKRAAWLESLDENIGRLKDEPQGEQFRFSELRSTAVKNLFMACDADEPRQCPASFDAAPGPASWSDADLLLLERYRALIQRRAWREHVGNDISQPIAPLGDLIAGQRLSLLALRGVDAATLRAALSDDLAYWRMMLASSDTLIAKMIAVAGLRHHFQFGSLLMRRVAPADRAEAIPSGWRAELTRGELDFDRPLAGELVQMEKVWRLSNLTDGEGEPRRVPFFQPQDIVNELAADYAGVAAAFEVPLAEYPRVAETLAQRASRHPFPSRLYDIGGDYLRKIGAAAYEEYPPRIAAVEAWRRAALVTAELRARLVPPAGVAAELVKDGLRNPFTGAPFAWSEAEQAVVYEGTEHQRAGRRRQVYSY